MIAAIIDTAASGLGLRLLGFRAFHWYYDYGYCDYQHMSTTTTIISIMSIGFCDSY